MLLIVVAKLLYILFVLVTLQVPFFDHPVSIGTRLAEWFDTDRKA